MCTKTQPGMRACEHLSLWQTRQRKAHRVTNQTSIAATPEASVRVSTKHKPARTTVPQESLTQNSENVHVIIKRNSAVRQMQGNKNQFHRLTSYSEPTSVRDQEHSIIADRPGAHNDGRTPQTQKLTIRRENATSKSLSLSLSLLLSLTLSPTLSLFLSLDAE